MQDWVLRFNADRPDGLATREAPGRASLLNDEQRARLAEIVEAGSIPAAHDRRALATCRSCPVGMGRVPGIGHALYSGPRASGDGLSQALRTAAPPRTEERGNRHFQKEFAARRAQIRARLSKGTRIDLWWQDEARLRWTERGTPPLLLCNQRRSSTWILDSDCPAEGKAASIVMPRCNSKAQKDN